MGPYARNPDFVHANNKGADQSVHPRSLISAFVICFIENIMTPLDTCINKI